MQSIAIVVCAYHQDYDTCSNENRLTNAHLRPGGPDPDDAPNDLDYLKEALENWGMSEQAHGSGNVLVYQHEGAKFAVKESDGRTGTISRVVNAAAESVRLDRSKFCF